MDEVPTPSDFWSDWPIGCSKVALRVGGGRGLVVHSPGSHLPVLVRGQSLHPFKFLLSEVTGPVCPPPCLARPAEVTAPRVGRSRGSSSVSPLVGPWLVWCVPSLPPPLGYEAHSVRKRYAVVSPSPHTQTSASPGGLEDGSCCPLPLLLSMKDLATGKLKDLRSPPSLESWCQTNISNWK